MGLQQGTGETCETASLGSETRPLRSPHVQHVGPRLHVSLKGSFLRQKGCWICGFRLTSRCNGSHAVQYLCHVKQSVCTHRCVHASHISLPGFRRSSSSWARVVGLCSCSRKLAFRRPEALRQLGHHGLGLRV